MSDKIKVEKIPAASIAVCVMGHSGPAGTFREGARLRGDHPAVAASPQFFMSDGFSDDEKHAELQRRFPDYQPGR